MRRFLAGALLGALAMLLVAVGSLVAVGHALSPEDPLERSDAIVAISGDHGPRAATAIALWQQGYAPLIIFAGSSRDPESVPSAELMKRQAVAAGVPEESVLVEPHSATTDQNAQRVAELMTGLGIRSAILVTSPYHQRRAAGHFAREFEAAGLTFRNYPARDPLWDRNRWWTEEPSRRITFVELGKLAFEALDRRFEPQGQATAPAGP